MYIYSDPINIPIFCDYIHSIIKTYKFVRLISSPKILKEKLKEECIFFFMQTIPPFVKLTNNIFLINTEQLTRPEWFEKISKKSKNVKTIDYSLANIRISKSIYFPYLVNDDEIYDYPKKFDIAITGKWESTRRKNIKESIRDKITLINEFGAKRDKELFQHKILLNVHYSKDYRIFEQFRCNRCILNKMIVISEKSDDIDFELKDHMIECEYDDIVETTKKVLENYEFYYHKLFDNFSLDDIRNKYKKISENAMSLIMKM